ncbi:class I SAM-dependent methyltransferase [Niabella beijingensis]|uniref:class I SAM-dependent methyltransferase n=1 Tax=Niabella beijingensis TaxID=2872700 RepID=UPI001CC019C1|nr:class I SAM-dependent methyltransferase [Niabella beijingensis]MBZ4192568.1 methyltransferase domain-containing protein [Niabella beijingensis]
MKPGPLQEIVMEKNSGHETDFRELAAQLRCPSGAGGSEVAAQMFAANRNMIGKTVDVLELSAVQEVLEIGFGSGLHVPDLFATNTSLRYHGVDISDLMVETAQAGNQQLTAAGKAVFLKTEAGMPLPFEADHFNAIFSVNTLYFWPAPEHQFAGCYRVLTAGGRMALAFIERSFGATLPFTRFGFTLYEADEVEQLFAGAGFAGITTIRHEEQIVSNTGKPVMRPFVVMVGKKE